MSVVSNKQLYLYTVGLLIVWVIVLTTASSSSSGSSSNSNLVSSAQNIEEDDKKNIKNCKTVCGHCACLDFYCGEECICECNNENKDTQCIVRMQENASRMKMPFELLIQGPSANSFVRNALRFEQNSEKRNSPNQLHKKRSTVIVYKPDLNGSMTSKSKLSHNLRVNGIQNLNERGGLERPKRSTSASDVTNQFEWFSDLTHNLVKPAPLGGRHKKTEESKTPLTDKPKTPKTRSPLDRSWFMDTIPNILTPAPIAKRPVYTSSEASDDDDGDEDNETSNINNKGRDKASSSSAEPLFPKTRKDSLRFIGQDLANAFGLKMDKTDGDDDDVGERKQMFTKNPRNKLKEDISLENYTDDLDSKLEDTLETLKKGKARKKLHETNTGRDLRRKPFKDYYEDEEAETEFRLPWWKPVRFFKRVQYVLKP